MHNQKRKDETLIGGIVFPPTETVRLDDATVRKLMAEGMEIRRAIEKAASRMFAVSPSESALKMR